MPARLLLIGLGTLADDQGVFQWKPTGIRLKLFPGDLIDIQDLLAELESVDFVRRFDVENRVFGAVRNFCSHQKPKRPNARYPLPEALFSFVKLNENKSLAPECGEHVPLGEEGRGGERRGIGEEEEGRGARARDFEPLIERFFEHRRKRDGKKLGDYARSRFIKKLERLTFEGHDAEAMIDAAIENNWASIYPPKGDRANERNSQTGSGLAQAAQQAIQAGGTRNDPSVQ